MQYCDECGAKLRTTSKFCPECGIALKRRTNQISKRENSKEKDIHSIQTNTSKINIQQAHQTNTSIPTPDYIVAYLNRNEKILKTGKSNEWNIFVTDNRVLFYRGMLGGKEIVEASYNHISSIEYRKSSSIGLIIAGIFCFIVGYLLYSFVDRISPILSGTNTVFGGLFVFLGICSFIAILLLRPSYTIHVVGRLPLTLTGRNLEPIMLIVRQYKQKVEVG